MEVEVALGIGRLGPGVANLTGRARDVIDLETATGDLGQNLERLTHAGPRSAADVVDAAGRGGGRGGRPDRPDHVAHEGEIARLPSVAEHRQTLAVESGAAEPVEGHVRSLPRPIDREDAKAHRLHAVIRVVEPTEMLAAELGDAVWRDRRRRGLLRGRKPLGLAVNRGGGCIDEALPRM